LPDVKHFQTIIKFGHLQHTATDGSKCLLS